MIASVHSTCHTVHRTQYRRLFSNFRIEQAATNASSERRRIPERTPPNNRLNSTHKVLKRIIPSENEFKCNRREGDVDSSIIFNSVIKVMKIAPFAQASNTTSEPIASGVHPIPERKRAGSKGYRLACE